MAKFNDVDIKEQFTVTCKKCGSKDVEIKAFEMKDLGVRAFIECSNCPNEVLDESWVD